MLTKAKVDQSIGFSAKPTGRDTEDVTVCSEKQPVNTVTHPAQGIEPFKHGLSPLLFGATECDGFWLPCRRRRYVSQLFALIEGCAYYEKIQVRSGRGFS